MNKKAGIMLVLAVLSGLSAMYGSAQLLGNNRNRHQIEMQDVVIAVRDIKAEEVIKDDMVKISRLPKAQIPAGTFGTVQEVQERNVLIPVLAGEAIVDAKLAARGTPAGLVSRIPAGMRAYAIEVNEQSGVSGFVLPGHRVDIVQSRLTTSPGQPESELLVQDVLVLASGQTFTRPEDKTILSRTVTLALTPEQVNILVAVRAKGPVTLSLRGVNDHTVVKHKVSAPPEPAKPVKVEPARLPPPPPKVLRIMHGLERVDEIVMPRPGDRPAAQRAERRP